MVFASAALSPAVARADLDLQLAASGGPAYMRSTPSFTTDELSTSARDIAQGTSIGGAGSMTLLGSTLDVIMTFRSGLLVPLGGLGVYLPVGSYGRVITSADGSIAELRPWSAYRVDVPLPGIGYRVNRRRYTFGGSVRTGVAWMRMSGSIAAGGESEAMRPTRSGFVLQAELEVCRRFDPTTRGCIQLAPRVIDLGGPLNGGLLSLRVEWGI